jgi:hypothetical protein
MSREQGRHIQSQSHRKGSCSWTPVRTPFIAKRPSHSIAKTGTVRFFCNISKPTTGATAGPCRAAQAQAQMPGTACAGETKSVRPAANLVRFSRSTFQAHACANSRWQVICTDAGRARVVSRASFPLRLGRATLNLESCREMVFELPGQSPSAAMRWPDA